MKKDNRLSEFSDTIKHKTVTLKGSQKREKRGQNIYLEK